MGVFTPLLILTIEGASDVSMRTLKSRDKNWLWNYCWRQFSRIGLIVSHSPGIKLRIFTGGATCVMTLFVTQAATPATAPAWYHFIWFLGLLTSLICLINHATVKVGACMTFKYKGKLNILPYKLKLHRIKTFIQTLTFYNGWKPEN